MLIKQIQFTEITEEENEIIPDFLNWVCKQMYSTINTKINRKKIQLRIKHLYEVEWINWTNSEYTDVQTLMETIYKSFCFEEYKNNIWKITIDNNIIIPNTTTSISRFIRFLDYGDMEYSATGIFNNLRMEYTWAKLNNLWRIYLLSENNIGITNSKLIVD